ncbi:hypothetical protein N7510_001216 [Penicillium lagena]|uniref:uncharacterized protein n=1 Tax=Penicillium lagena TaxID=94218 RepID=UPI0025417053|nr:uncharacterized protein N7510_001216 [Penicillium lagena]KAJ5624907.1 hypothetical protein N7510_001216 [Penicillium lagena]
MARSSTTRAQSVPRPEKSPQINDEEGPEDARSEASVPSETIPVEITYPKLPRTSLAAEEGRRESFYVCAVEDNPDPSAGPQGLGEQLKYTQLTLSEFKKAFRKDPDALFDMILKRERLWTVYANTKDQEARTAPPATTSGHEQELEAIQAEYEDMKLRLETERNNYAHQLLQNQRIAVLKPNDFGGRRSVKMPDAPIMDDGKDMDFEV